MTNHTYVMACSNRTLCSRDLELVLMEIPVGMMHEDDDVLHGATDVNYSMTRYVRGTSRTATMYI